MNSPINTCRFLVAMGLAWTGAALPVGAQVLRDGDFQNNRFTENKPVIIRMEDFDTWWTGHAQAFTVRDGRLVRDGDLGDRKGGTAVGGVFRFPVAVTGTYELSFDYTAYGPPDRENPRVFLDVVAYDPLGAVTPFDSRERLGLRTANRGMTFSDPFGEAAGPLDGLNYTIRRPMPIKRLGEDGFPTGENRVFRSSFPIEAGTELVAIRIAATAGPGETIEIDNIQLRPAPTPPPPDPAPAPPDPASRP